MGSTQLASHAFCAASTSYGEALEIARYSFSRRLLVAIDWVISLCPIRRLGEHVAEARVRFANASHSNDICGVGNARKGIVPRVPLQNSSIFQDRLPSPRHCHCGIHRCACRPSEGSRAVSSRRNSSFDATPRPQATPRGGRHSVLSWACCVQGTPLRHSSIRSTHGA